MAFALLASVTARGDDNLSSMLKSLDVDSGIVALLDLPDGGAQRVIELAKSTEGTIYFQSADAD